MTSRDFCYWLQGLFELGAPTALDEKQTAAVKAHLNMVFLHEIDPLAGDEKHQAELNAAHEGVTKAEVLELIKNSPRPFSPSDTVIRC